MNSRAFYRNKQVHRSGFCINLSPLLPTCQLFKILFPAVANGRSWICIYTVGAFVFYRTTTGAQKGYTVQVIFRSQLKTSAGAVVNGVTDAEGYVNVYPKVFVSARFSHAATQKFQPYPVKPLRILGSSKVKKLHPNHLIFADLIGF